MVLLRNANYDEFILENGDKDIIIFGAGKVLGEFLVNHTWDGRVLLLNRIIAVLDNDTDKSGWEIFVGKRTVKVETLASYLERGRSFNNCVIILMLKNSFLMQVVNQLDNVEELDGITCYYGLSTPGWGNEIYLPLPISPVLPVPAGKYRIPKTIHYCWFGGKPLPASASECIESWEHHCPDYEIKQWNENNYDIPKTPLYVRQAFDAGKYAFVSDYARLDIINRQGGIYFDVDVELLQSIDNLLGYKAFFGFLTWSTINTGLGFGSVSCNEVLSDMMSMYNLFEFVLSNGLLYTVDCPRLATEYFRRNGVLVNNTIQMVDDILFLPSSYMSPLSAVTGSDGRQYLALYALRNNTISIHKCDSSWFDEESDEVMNKLKKEYAPINKRLYSDWKRSRFSE